MKQKLACATFVLGMLVLSQVVLAAHTSKVEFGPSTWDAATVSSVEVKLASDKTSRNNVIGFLLEIPFDESGSPLYSVKDDVTLPPGWTYSLSYRNSTAYQITFSNAGLGLTPGSSIIFRLNEVKASNKVGTVKWSFNTTDSVSAVFSDSIATEITPGPLKNFVISGEPSEAKYNDPVYVNVTAYNQFGNMKTDYIGTIEVVSSDKDALIVPRIYTMTAEDSGMRQVLIRFKTPGDQNITVADKSASVVQVSKSIKVLSPTPRSLTISIDDNLPTTTKTSVALKLGAADAKDCRYSNDKILWTDYEPYVASKEWSLTAGDGKKTVYFQCKNDFGETDIVSDDIELKTVVTPPPQPEQKPSLLTRLFGTGFFGLSTSALASAVAFVISILALIISLTSRGKKKAE